MPITISHVKSVTIADWSGAVTIGNSTGGTATAQASDLVRPSDWNATHANTLAVTGSEIASLFAFNNGLSSATGAGGVTAGISNYGFFEPTPLNQSNSINDAPGMGTWYFQPFVLPYGLANGRINMFCQRNSNVMLNGVAAVSTQGNGAWSATASWRNCLAIYSQGTGANVTRLESVWTGECAVSATRSMQFSGATSGMTASNYLTLGMISQINTAGGTTSTGITTSGTTSTATTSLASTAPNALISGAINWFTGSAMDVVPFSSTLSPGVYWLANMFTTHSGAAGTTSANYTSAQTYFNASNSYVKYLDVNLSAYKRLGSTTSANSSSQWVPFHGSLATTSSNATSIVASSDMQAFSRRLYWNYVQDTF